jgi:hypothetical protein
MSTYPAFTSNASVAKTVGAWQRQEKRGDAPQQRMALKETSTKAARDEGGAKRASTRTA